MMQNVVTPRAREYGEVFESHLSYLLSEIRSVS